MAASGEKEKLTITACNVDDNGKVSVDDSRVFKFTLNPDKFEHTYEIGYSDKGALGQSATNTKFSGTRPETLKIGTIIDTTGAVGEAGAADKDLITQLKDLMDIVYKYEGDKHEPNVVQVVWGNKIFLGRLQSISVNNTLFKASGESLRARLELVFKSFMSNEEESARANRSSPDMSHTVVVKAGDTPPLLCHRIYRDSSYYLEVAAHNDLTDFRDLEPGSKLHFPPLS